ncbi:hypothetical protein BGX29_004586 [Mortierella sp. GBA35]|nr:hypothetical protein BGX29_004586 [Mortierella sp. GBA35]
MLSYVSLIPPLDGLILNYKKLDQWKEQKHFRVQLEAQRIYEQQLHQEQNLTRMIPAYHPNSMTVYAHMAMGSPKQLRAFSAINAGSASFNGTGGTIGGPGVGSGVGSGGAGGVHSGIGNGGGAGVALTAMFSPPISPSRRIGHHPLSVVPLPGQQQQVQHYAEQEIQFPRHQPQSKLQGSISNFVSQGGGGYQASQQMAMASQDNLVMANVRRDTISGTQQDLSTDNAILKSSSQHHPYPPAQQYGDNKSRRPDQQQQHQLPLRTTNKPAPPHDPFRKTSLSGTNRAPFQSLYQPPEPHHQSDMNRHTQQQQSTGYYHDSYMPPVATSTAGVAARIVPSGVIGSAGTGGALALTATGRILSSIGGMSGCYGIVDGVPQPMMMTTGLPSTKTPTSYGGVAAAARDPQHSTSSSKQQR